VTLKTRVYCAFQDTYLFYAYDEHLIAFIIQQIKEFQSAPSFEHIYLLKQINLGISMKFILFNSIDHIM
jgi:hypothetical protein